MARKNTAEETRWRKAVIKRDKVCVVCSAPYNLQAHHIDCYSFHPESRFLVSNGACVCDECHTLYHTSYNLSFRAKTDRKDWNNFLELIGKLKNKWKL